MGSKFGVIILSILVVLFLTAVGYMLLRSEEASVTFEKAAQERGLSANSNSENVSGAPAMDINMNKTYKAVLKTTKGNIVIDLGVKSTPVTVNNFIYLARKNFYNNTIFHRVISDFMIQGGDPRGDGTGGPGYKFADEPFDGEYTRGTVAMANAGPNTNGSQFFIMHADYPLPKNYVIFGRVVDGIDVVDTVAGAEVVRNYAGELSRPANPVTIIGVDIQEK